MTICAFYLNGIMMNVSKTAGYAIHALGCLPNGGHHPRFIRNVAAAACLKKPYLAKIVNQLVHRGLVTGKRGYRGGIALARAPESISLLEIVQATEGEQWISPCLFGLEVCPARRGCPGHAVWEAVCRQMEAFLRQTTLADVIKAAARSARRKPTAKATPPTPTAGTI